MMWQNDWQPTEATAVVLIDMDQAPLKAQKKKQLLIIDMTTSVWVNTF